MRYQNRPPPSAAGARKTHRAYAPAVKEPSRARPSRLRRRGVRRGGPPGAVKLPEASLTREAPIGPLLRGLQPVQHRRIGDEHWRPAGGAPAGYDLPQEDGKGKSEYDDESPNHPDAHGRSSPDVEGLRSF